MPKRQRNQGDSAQERVLVKRPRQSKPEEPQEPLNINTARDVHLLLAFHQDVKELKSGIKKFKIFLQTILYPPEGQSANVSHLEFLGEYLEFQKPKEVEGEESIYVKDLIQSWIFASEKNDDSLFSATVAILALLLKTISTKIDLRDHGLGICRTVLQQNTAKLLYKGLSGPRHKEHIISPCLRLLTEIASFDAGTMGRQLYNRRDQVFEPRVIARTLGLTGAAKDDIEEMERKPSVRSNAIRYVLANLKFQAEGIKMDIIKQSNIISALLNGLQDDSATLIAEVLSVIEINVLQDRNITWSSKSQLVNDRALRSLAALYHMETPDEKPSGSEKTILEIFHEFMLRICTSSDAGALRYSSGLYPPNSGILTNEDDDHDDKAEEDVEMNNDISELHTQVLKKVTVRNHALANFAQSLRPYANDLERELLLAILHAAPELIADYWLKKENFTFEPKLTSTWIGYSAFIFSAIQLPVPRFFGARSGYPLHPPPASIVLESILPLPLNQKVLKKCLGQSSLIRFFATRILVIALEKLKIILGTYQQVDAETPNKSWAQAIPTLSAMFIRRCPNMKDIIEAFRKVPEDDLMQREASTRLLALCYEVIPQLALTEKFDISMALTISLQRAHSAQSSATEDTIRLVELAHLVKIASHSTDISWWKRPEKLKVSAFLATLLVQVKSSEGARHDLEQLLLQVVVEKGLLQSQTNPPALRALIQSLKEDDEIKISNGTLQFIDDCLGRFVTRQIVYEDQLDSFIASNGIDRKSMQPISLWVATLLEQWPFVEKNRKYDIEAIGSWLMRFTQGLLECGEDETFLAAVVTTMEQTTSDEKTKMIFAAGLKKNNKDSKAMNEIDTRKLNDGDDKDKDSTIHTVVSFDISVYNPPAEAQPPNFVKFKTGDVLTILESSSMTNLIFSLSSEDAPTRIQATSALQHFMIRLESSTDPDREMIYLLLGELVETAQNHQREYATALSYVISAFAVEALVVIRDPTHAMYPKVAAFLTLRPQWSPYKLVREFLASTILSEPSEDSDSGPWKESAWLLRWLNNGLRTLADCDILRQVGAWETIGGLGAHPGLGQSKASSVTNVTSFASSRPQKTIRKLILDLLGRTIALGEAATLATRAGGLAWLNVWERLGWVDVKIAAGLRDTILAQGKDRVGKWSFGMLNKSEDHGVGSSV